MFGVGTFAGIWAVDQCAEQGDADRSCPHRGDQINNITAIFECVIGKGHNSEGLGQGGGVWIHVHAQALTMKA
jgi:hypothetical protein